MKIIKKIVISVLIVLFLISPLMILSCAKKQTNPPKDLPVYDPRVDGMVYYKLWIDAENELEKILRP